MLQGFFECFDGACFKQFFSAAAADFAVFAHCGAIAFPVEAVVLFGCNLLEGFGGNAVRLVQACGLATIHHDPARGVHVIEDFCDTI